MVFLDESPASWLLRPLRRSASEEKQALHKANKANAIERSLDMAEMMEQGLSRELVSDFTQPLQHSNRLWKFQVERSEDKHEFRLYCSRGEFLMFARVARDARHVSFFLYDPLSHESTLYDPDRPAFTMSYSSSKTEWRLFQERCDSCHYSPQHLACGCCQGRLEILDIHHSRQAVGDGVNHCMDIYAPASMHCEEQRFVSKLPVWNDEVASLVLDFKGRRVLASAKNFQLAQEEHPGHVVCQYGKIGPDTFGLDFRYPMTVIQAFSISLTTLFWV